MKLCLNSVSLRSLGIAAAHAWGKFLLITAAATGNEQRERHVQWSTNIQQGWGIKRTCAGALYVAQRTMLWFIYHCKHAPVPGQQTANGAHNARASGWRRRCVWCGLFVLMLCAHNTHTHKRKRARNTRPDGWDKRSVCWFIGPSRYAMRNSAVRVDRRPMCHSPVGQRACVHTIRTPRRNISSVCPTADADLCVKLWFCSSGAQTTEALTAAALTARHAMRTVPNSVYVAVLFVCCVMGKKLI